MKASKTEKRASSGERAEPKFDSVLDFLYYDSRRVGLFISQFDDAGILQQIEKAETVVESASDKAGITTSIGPRAFSLRGRIDKGTEESGSDSSKRTYDPLWVNALSFLDFLEERNLIRRDLKKSRIGQLLLVP